MSEHSAERDAGLDKRQKRRARRRRGLTPEGIERHFTRRKYVTRSWKRAMEAARKRGERLIAQPCSEGNCVELIDPETGENTGGWGPVGCPCQDTDARVTSPEESRTPTPEPRADS